MWKNLHNCGGYVPFDPFCDASLHLLISVVEIPIRFSGSISTGDRQQVTINRFDCQLLTQCSYKLCVGDFTLQHIPVETAGAKRRYHNQKQSVL